MTPQFVALIVAVLSAGSVGLLACVALEFVGRRWVNVSPWLARPSISRLGDIFSQVPVPWMVRLRWFGSNVELRLIQSGVPWTSRAYAGFRWLCLWLAELLTLALLLAIPVDLVAVFLVVLLQVGGVIGPDLWLDVRAERRRAQAELALPDFLDRLALGLEAGLGFELAFRRTAANFRHLLGEELRRVTRQIDLGHSRATSLGELGRRIPSSDLKAFVATVNQAERLGTSLAKALRVQTDLLRVRRKRRAEEASRRLPVLIVFPLVLFFLPALLIVYLAPPILHIFLGP
jgi:pilus assembly protein TadC